MIANLREAAAPGDDATQAGGDDGMSNADTGATEAGAPLDDADTDSSSSNDADQGTGNEAGGSIDAGPGPDATVPVDAGVTVDAGHDAGSTVDAGHAVDAGGPPVDAGQDAGSDAGPCANLGASCVVVPTGWALVAFAPAQSTACPTGFGSELDVVEGPDAGSACSCGTCSTTTQPTCASGAVGLSFDTKTSILGGTCLLPRASLANSPAGTCRTDLAAGSYETYDLEFSAPAASGGVCAAPTVTGAVTYTAEDRTCTPVSLAAANCSGGACTPTLTSPYEACISWTTPGQVACPAGPLSVQHVVGTSATFSCSACGCSVTATCAGTLTMYSDIGCSKNPASFSTGACTAVVGGAGNSTADFTSYKYSAGAPSKVKCTATAGTAEDVTLTNETTICCAH
jgi:hypothetical protein